QDASFALFRDPAGTIDRWLLRAGFPDSRHALLPGLEGVLALLLVLWLVRGRGDLRVSIEYPAELRGTFSVSIRQKGAARKSARPARSNPAQPAKRRSGAASRTERHLVSRETDFHRIASGRWRVTVEGFLQPPDEETVVGSHHEEQEVRVHRGETVRVDFDFRLKLCPVDVVVSWDKHRVHDAQLAWLGQPDSLRYARGGPVRMGAPRGKQTVVVGARDRVAEHSLQITSFQPLSVAIDLADRKKLLFTGCPLAVDPYLHGDIPGAARALEREGQEPVAHLLLARLHQEQGHEESAANHYAQAGKYLEAAELYRKLSQFAKSAELFERAGELVRAARMYHSAGEITKAGDAYQRAREYAKAADCFKKARDIPKWCEALERDGKPLEAARVALDHGAGGRAIRCLQLLPPGHEDYVEAANLLVDVLQQEGHLDLAIGKIEEVIRTQGADRVPLESCDRLARLLEESGHYERAIDALEIIRRRDATWPELAAGIERLRKKRQDARVKTQSQPGAAVGDGFRYEILEEIGRGGMGIVFKARDRRLGRVVALKRLPDNLRNHPKAVDLFLREARASASLNHPNIVTVHDAGQEGETFYITMELLEGYPLQQILSRKGTVGALDVARLGIQVCNGLAYAHDNKIIHRDIKTANLFFTKDRTLKIMDFGLAKMVEEVRRVSTVIGGTPCYMAPEQSLGGAVDYRADLYALGVTLFELLTGQLPFAEGDVAFHHRHTAPPNPRDLAASVPEAMAALVLDLMAKRPEQRPESALAARERLRTAMREERA
ncbi:MAG: protein kinase, partial [Myxococcota bacterium]